MSRLLLFVTLILLSVAGHCQNKLSPQSLLRFDSAPKIIDVTRDHHFLIALWEWNRPTKFPENLLPDVNIRTQIQVWEIDEEWSAIHKTRTFSADGYGIDAIEISPDGALVAAVCNDKKLRLWRIADGLLYRTFTPPTGQVFSCCKFLPDSQKIAVGGRELDLNPNADYRLLPLENNFQILDITSQRTLVSAKPGRFVVTIAFAPDGRHFAINTVDSVENLVFGKVSYGGARSSGVWGIWDRDSKLFGTPTESVGARFSNQNPYEPADLIDEGIMRLQFSNDSKSFMHAQNAMSIHLEFFKINNSTLAPTNIAKEITEPRWIATKFNSSPQRTPVCGLSSDGSRVVWADDTSLLFWDAKTEKTSESYDIGIRAEYLDMDEKHRVLVQSGAQISTVFLPN